MSIEQAKAALLPLAVILLASCGGGGGDPPADPGGSQYDTDTEFSLGTTTIQHPRFSGTTGLVIGRASKTATAGTFELQAGRITVQSTRQ